MMSSNRDVSSTGWFNLPAQLPVNSAYTNNAVTSSTSKYQGPVPSVVPGYSVAFSLTCYDKAPDTFAKTGQITHPPVRTSLRGVPLPPEIKTDDEIAEFLDHVIAPVGATYPSVSGTATHGGPLIMHHGSIDVLVHETVVAGETLIWQVPTVNETIKASESRSSELMRKNPGALRLVPLKGQNVFKSFSHAIKKHLTPRIAKSAVDAFGAGGSKLAHGPAGGNTPLQSRQARMVHEFLEETLATMALLTTMKSGGSVSDADAIQLGNHLAKLATTTAGFSSDLNRHIYGVALTSAPAGNTAHVKLAAMGCYA